MQPGLSQAIATPCCGATHTRTRTHAHHAHTQANTHTHASKHTHTRKQTHTHTHRYLQCVVRSHRASRLQLVPYGLVDPVGLEACPAASW